jgi:hypothetical protein
LPRVFLGAGNEGRAVVLFIQCATTKERDMRTRYAIPAAADHAANGRIRRRLAIVRSRSRILRRLSAAAFLTIAATASAAALAAVPASGWSGQDHHSRGHHQKGGSSGGQGGGSASNSQNGNDTYGERPGLFEGRRHHHHHFHPVPEEAASVQLIASGLNQPKKLTVDPWGDLLVALSGDGMVPPSCTDGTQPSCVDSSGAIDRVTPSGKVATLLGNLVSVGGPEGQATGPAEARFEHGGLNVLFQNTAINPTTGEQAFGPAGALLGDLVKFPPFGGAPDVLASFGPFEAANNPDNGEGTGVELGIEQAIDSDPYSFAPYHHGWVVADAAADDLLYVSHSGTISVLAVFPTIPEVAPPGTLGPSQTAPVPVQAQPVPDSVAVGPDGALSVGELGGVPFNPGTSSVFRVVAGHAPTVVASGLTAIADIAFDRAGRLLVLEIDQQGLGDAFSSGSNPPAPGAIIGVQRDGTQTTLASTGLEFPTGMAVAGDGSVYVSNYGVLPATGGPGGLSGEVVRVVLPASWQRSG